MSKLAVVLLACALASAVSEPLLVSSPLVTGPALASAYPAYAPLSYSAYAPPSTYSAYTYAYSGPGYPEYLYSSPVVGLPYAYSADYIYRR